MVSHTVVQFRPEHFAGSLFQTTPRIGFGSLALFSLLSKQFLTLPVKTTVSLSRTASKSILPALLIAQPSAPNPILSGEIAKRMRFRFPGALWPLPLFALAVVIAVAPVADAFLIPKWRSALVDKSHTLNGCPGNNTNPNVFKTFFAAVMDRSVSGLEAIFADDAHGYLAGVGYHF